jgi:hypothetical protein
MIPASLDWRVHMSCWSFTPLLQLLAGEPVTPAHLVGRYVLRLTCSRCGRHFLGESPVALPQPCPACDGPLQRVASWDLVTEARPGWSDHDYDER